MAGTNPVMVDDTARTLRELGAEVAVAGANLDLDRLKTVDPHVIVHHRSAFSRNAVARAVARIPRMRGALRVAIQGVPHWPRAFEPLVETVEKEMKHDRSLSRRLVAGAEICLEETGSARLLRATMELGDLLRVTLRVQMMRLEVELEGDLVLGARLVDDNGTHYLDGRAALALAMSLDRGIATGERLVHPTFVSIVAPLSIALEDQRVSEPPNESWSTSRRESLGRTPRPRVSSEPPSDLVMTVDSRQSPEALGQPEPPAESATGRSRDSDPPAQPSLDSSPDELVIETTVPTKPLRAVPPRTTERMVRQPRRVRGEKTAPTLKMSAQPKERPSSRWPSRLIGAVAIAAVAMLSVMLFRAPLPGGEPSIEETTVPPPVIAAPSSMSSDEPAEREAIDEPAASSEAPRPADAAGPQPPQVSSASALEPFLPQRITRHHDRERSDELLAEARATSGAERFALLRDAAQAHPGNPHVAEAIAREALEMRELDMAEAWARRAVRVRRHRPVYRELLAEILAHQRSME